MQPQPLRLPHSGLTVPHLAADHLDRRDEHRALDWIGTGAAEPSALLRTGLRRARCAAPPHVTAIEEVSQP